MGIVSEHLVGLIAKQIEERSLVVWYDPGADYKNVAVVSRSDKVPSSLPSVKIA